MTDDSTRGEPPPLTYEETTRVLVRLAHLDHPIVLVGGQAVNFWAEYYLDRAPDLAKGAPYASKDIDFCGSPQAVQECAKRLGGRAKIATDPAVPQGLEHMGTPNTGTVTFVDDIGVERTIDFLKEPAGVEWAETLETSQSASILDDHGNVVASFRVMHPILSLESRAFNVAYLPGYQTDHAKNQLRAAIVCAREFILEGIADDDVEATLERNERIFSISAFDAGPLVFVRYNIDVFGALVVDQKLPSAFLEKRLPQMREFVDKRRAKFAAAEARARAFAIAKRAD